MPTDLQVCLFTIYSCKPFFLFLKFSGIFVLRLGLAVGIWHIWEPAVGMGGGVLGSGEEVFSSCIQIALLLCYRILCFQNHLIHDICYWPQT